ncbi:hypothetical protein BU24DRAFT_462405 [Aaosphaeria arxii CBS 175.79]|uniref:Uncharacterized protein n=1 Tax=Aaosphaeria arxii CBS 175.79 TaxID=1450172 RepID=A0A6A5XVD8_9PLEO|nr:uncharacterized protein BU24DRAFT_462405 [Aaosphaeria arxii CBS 175.79]KAF2016224.1 hypothetical protein BU24DRAFT_462405 [Aaosphaeria arxii CBS 175.79]
MSFLRPISIVRTSALRPLSRRAAAAAAPRAYVPVRLAHQDYGSGDGNPVGENPQQQGKNPRSELEHPGPPAPKVGQGKSSSSSSSSSSSKSGEEKGGHRTGGKGSNRDSPSSSSGGSGSGSKGTKGAQPKILNENPPGEHDESVRQHNKEMEQRAEKAHEQVSNEDAKKDKVSPKFWSGQGGADKDP